MATKLNEMYWESVGNYTAKAVIKSMDHNHQIKHTHVHVTSTMLYVQVSMCPTKQKIQIDLCSL